MPSAAGEDDILCLSVPPGWIEVRELRHPPLAKTGFGVSLTDNKIPVSCTRQVIYSFRDIQIFSEPFLNRAVIASSGGFPTTT